ncbi:TetR family transcriptional regulator [Streptomyces sp. KhCrAH-43]|uniref:TetR/AcrR family transcriptional regulator n=1 Tax=unclassified Streptomyces TaxID=2593676 RepID=UPI00038108BC|nr:MULTISPECIES: TetR/AcrR family transcriptional regulator [unclassified Streptomyces]MYS34226.1 TetR family transcriptional regulator [Streptomyces sp. SID4920]MYX68610.1 TetR family transcriptional regulator [Streptomyces sp. SID8373]RAJ50860.1 TetR family transcriptional regulator [Streptomyces sp. KhCrAH-43]
MVERKRADARRNYERILAVAEAEVAAQGAAASLEQIARVAGVGSATVRRHFPTRPALLEAVSRQRIGALCARARELAAGEDDDGRGALLEWLGEVVAYCVTARGLAAALSYDEGQDPVRGNSCAAPLIRAGKPLLRSAVRNGAVAPHVTVEDLITLAVGLALATEHHPEPAARAEALLRLTVAGISPE